MLFLLFTALAAGTLTPDLQRELVVAEHRRLPLPTYFMDTDDRTMEHFERARIAFGQFPRCVFTQT